VKRKIRDVIKKDKEEKDSLFEEIKFKSQAAMEYLMTYGWAILIIALSLVVLYSLGIMNPKNFIPRAPPGSCFVFRPNGPGTTDFISLQGTCGYLPMYVASFNGVNSYIKISPGPTPSSAFTLAAWVKANSFPTAWPGILGANAYGLTNPDFNPYALYFDSGGSVYVGSRGNGDTWHYVVYHPQIPTSWHYVVGIFNGSYLNLYVDGIFRGSAACSSPIQYGSQTIVAIGADDTNGDGIVDGYWFNGSIANVQIYNTALTPQEIQYLYQQGLGGGPIRLGSLVGWWPLNGDAKDYSGNNNHGTINGGVTFVQNYNPP
jgi:hypothetical protein